MESVFGVKQPAGVPSGVIPGITCIPFLVEFSGHFKLYNSYFIAKLIWARLRRLTKIRLSFGKTIRSTHCELGQLEIIERDEGPDYLRVIVKEGLVVGGQAIGLKS